MKPSEELRLTVDETYLSYVSPLLQGRLKLHRPVIAPEVESVSGAVALIDIVRFSAFAERMSAQGNAGVEKVADRINATFAVVVESIGRYGGVAHAFPGDSVVALWPAEGRGMEDSVLLAARCILELLEIHRDDELPLKAGLSVGEMSMAHLGGVDGRIQFLLSGAALDEMGRAEERASRGRLIVATAAWNLLSSHAVAAVETDGFFEIKSLRSAAPTAAPMPTPEEAAGALTGDAARPYLPEALLRQLDAGQRDWVGEFREVTVAFIQVRTAGGSGREMAAVQRAFAAVQTSVFRHGGDITRFGHDDKGLSVLAVFGVTPASSEDAPTRAVDAAVEIHKGAPRESWRCRIGVATGRVFCGTLGAPRRREYSVVGSTANLAARLMQSLDGGVLCDSATRKAAGADFENAGRLRPKGFPEAIEVFRPTGISGSAFPSAALQRTAAALFGRDAEQHRLCSWVERMRDHHAGGLAMIEGEAGIGKTSLLREVLGHARSCGVEVVPILCRAAESTASYAAWGKALSSLLHLERVSEAQGRLSLLRRAMTDAGVQAELAPLVGPVFGFDVEENALTLAMSGAARGDNLLAALSRLVSHLGTRSREAGVALLIAFEDAHWLDPASWALLNVVARGIDRHSLGLIFTLRPQGLAMEDDYEAIRSLPLAERVGLHGLSAAQTGDLARRVLGANELGPHLVQITYERTRGNPFFCEQLLLALAESGVVGVEDGRAVLRVRNPEQAEGLVPRSIATVLTARLDHLPAPVLLTLKAASVIGTSFRLSLLTAIHPMRHDQETVLAHLASADEVGLVERDRDDATTLRFRHALTCEVAYDLLLASQQRELHRDVAEALSAADASPTSQSVLFYHWRRSGDEARALHHVDSAGAEAMRNGDYHSAVDLYGYALKTVAAGRHTRPEPPAPGEPAREAVWSAHLGEAQVAIGLHEPAGACLEQCLVSLGEDAPVATLQVVVAVASQAARQFLHRLMPRRFVGTRSRDGAVLALAASAWEQLGFVLYSAGQTIRGLHAALRILNLAELAGRQDSMARSYGVMSLTMSVVGQHRLAALYDRRAVRLARDSDDGLTQAYVGWVTGLRAVGEANWGLVATRLKTAQGIAESSGDLRLNVMCLQNQAWVPYTRGDIARARELAEAQLAIARESNNRLWEAWALNGLSETASMAGDHETTVRYCRRALEVLSVESDRHEEVRALGLSAAASAALGKHDDATIFARRALDLVANLEWTSFAAYSGLCGLSEVLLRDAEAAHARGTAMAPTLRRDLKRTVTAISRFAGRFALGRTRLHVVRARVAALDGSQANARHQFNRALRCADDFSMPYEKGLALLEAGRSPVFDVPARRRRALEATRVLPVGAALVEAKQVFATLDGGGA